MPRVPMQEELPSSSIGETIWDWLGSRNYLRLLLAVPAFLAVGGVLLFAVAQVRWSSARAEANCLDVGRSAFASGDHARASLAFQNLIRLRGTAEPDYLFRIAQSLAATDQREEAVAMLSALAPIDQPRYAPAHLFLAQALLQATEQNPRTLQVVISQLQQALKLEPHNAQVHYLMGRILAMQGRWEDARKHLSEAVSAQPEAALLFAVAQQQLGDEAAARSWAERAAKYFSGRAQQAAADEPLARVSWADALVLLKQYETAATVLETGRRISNHSSYPGAIGNVCANWAAAVAQDKPGDVAARFQIVMRGLQAAPGHPGLLRELATLSSAKGDGGESAKRVVNELLAEGKNAGLLHFCLGGLAWQRGETNDAQLHFDAAYALEPNMPDLANNLAALLTDGPEPDLTRALSLVEPILKKHPENPYYRDTRGHILLRQGHPEAALKDLEFALPKLSEKRPTHQALSQAYEKLGFPELAAEHRRRAGVAGTNSPAVTK